MAKKSMKIKQSRKPKFSTQRIQHVARSVDVHTLT